MDANGNLSNFDYDGFDRLRRLYFPNGTLGSGVASTTDYEEYGYDANNNRTSLRLRSSESIGYTYDALNREIVKDIPGGTTADVTSRYDLAGRRTFSRFSTTLTPSSDCTATGNPGIDYCYDTWAVFSPRRATGAGSNWLMMLHRTEPASRIQIRPTSSTLTMRSIVSIRCG